MRKQCPAWFLFVSLAIGLLAGFSGVARAGFIEAIGMSPRSAAMGGAAVAVAETPDSWYTNPAGMAQIAEDVQEVGFPQIAFLNLKQSDNTGSGGRESDKTPTVYSFAFPGTMHIGPKGLVLGIGGAATWGEAAQWSQVKGDLRFSGYESSLLVNTLSPCAAYEILPGLYIGATFNIDALNQLEGRQKLGDGYFTDAAIEQLNLPPALRKALEPTLRKVLNSTNGQDDGKFEVQTDEEFPTGLAPTNTLAIDFKSYSWNAGILWRPIPPLRLGVTYRDRMFVTFKGGARVVFADDVKAIVNNNPLVRALYGGPLQDGHARFEAGVDFPRQVQAGVSLQPNEQMLVALDGVWTNWSAAWDEQTVRFSGEGLLGLKKQVFERNFRDTYEIRLGWEYRASDRVWTEAGVWWDPTPVPDSTIDSGTLDADRIIFSIGTTLRSFLAEPTGWASLKGLDLGVVFQWLQFFDRKIARGESLNLGGTRNFTSSVNDFPFSFSGSVQNIGVALTYNF